MIGYWQSNERVLYPVADGEWMIGRVDAPILLPHFLAFEDIFTAMQSPNQCVLRSLIGVDNSEFIPAFIGEEAYDETAQRMFREIEENITLAKSEGQYDLVAQYETQLDELKEYTKGDLITPYKSKRLDAGDPIKPLTHSLRQRKLRGVKALREVGLSDEADDINATYVVADRSVMFDQNNSLFQWILSPKGMRDAS